MTIPLPLPATEYGPEGRKVVWKLPVYNTLRHISVAGLMITTEAMVAEAPKKKEAPAMPPGGMGGMDY